MGKKAIFPKNCLKMTIRAGEAWAWPGGAQTSCVLSAINQYFATALPAPRPSALVTSFAFAIMKPASLVMAMN